MIWWFSPIFNFEIPLGLGFFGYQSLDLVWVLLFSYWILKSYLNFLYCWFKLRIISLLAMEPNTSTAWETYTSMLCEVYYNSNYSFLFEQQEHEPANTSGSWRLEPNDVILKALKYFLVIK